MTDYKTFQRNWDKIVGEKRAQQFADWKASSEMSLWLQAKRIDAGYTEAEIAEALGWSEENVIEFEMSEVTEIHFGNLLPYLSALGLKMQTRFSRADETSKDQVEYLQFEIHELLRNLVEIAGDDPKLIKETLEFIYKYNESAIRMGATLATMFKNSEAVVSAMKEKMSPDIFLKQKQLPEHPPSSKYRESETLIVG